MRGFYIDPYSSKEKTREELQIYLDLTSPETLTKNRLIKKLKCILKSPFMAFIFSSAL
jgi:hypothetical protein